MLRAVWPGRQGHQLQDHHHAGQLQRCMEVQDLQKHRTSGVKKGIINPLLLACSMYISDLTLVSVIPIQETKKPLLHLHGIVKFQLVDQSCMSKLRVKFYKDIEV